jgi:hypothetical protein
MCRTRFGETVRKRGVESVETDARSEGVGTEGVKRAPRKSRDERDSVKRSKRTKKNIYGLIRVRMRMRLH